VGVDIRRFGAVDQKECRDVGYKTKMARIPLRVRRNRVAADPSVANDDNATATKGNEPPF
jgi:hypothetical protein